MLAGGRADPKASSSASDSVLLYRKASEGTADKLELIVENLGEDEFVSAVKGYKPDITKEELQEWVMRFRAAVREKRGLY